MNTISHDELRGMLDRNELFTLLNILSVDSFEAGHIPGSHRISLLAEQNFGRAVEHTVWDKDEKIVVYGANSESPLSREAAQTLEQSGFTNVQVYEGGMKDWQEAGLPIETVTHVF